MWIDEEREKGKKANIGGSNDPTRTAVVIEELAGRSRRGWSTAFKQV